MDTYDPRSFDKPAPGRQIWGLRDFRLLASSRLVSQLGDQLQALALPLPVLALTGSPAQAGLVLGLQTVTYLALGLVAGAVVDRGNRKRIMIGCEVARAVMTATVPLAAATGMLGMPQLYAVAAVNGVLSTLFDAANSSALPDIVRPEDLPAAPGGLSAVSSAVRVAGAAVAGLVYGVGRLIPFAFNAGSFLISAVSLRAISTDFRDRSERAGWLAFGRRDPCGCGGCGTGR